MAKPLVDDARRHHRVGDFASLFDVIHTIGCGERAGKPDVVI
jgi:hypothetical protein